VAFEDINYGISIGKDGMDVYTSDGGETWGTTPPIKDHQEFNGSRNSLKLGQNYPNPFNPSTVISFELPAAGDVSLKVYDIAGKEVANLLNGFLSSGNHNVTFNASGLASGVYFYRLNISNSAENTSRVMKMILTK
ncbi:MAG: T9SS type A sorting domain-containing protein, partial [Ignavibacteria bacterium]